MLPPIFKVNNLPPILVSEFKGLNENNVVSEPMQIQFPDMIDPNGDPFDFYVFLPDVPFEINPISGNLTVKEGETLAPGNYTIFITMKDGDRTTQVPFTFTVLVPIFNDIPLLIPFASTQFDPVPRIKSLNSRGVLVIRWD